jgi:MATE family multidrug resistance protein
LGYAILGVPSALFLAFYLKQGLVGLWIGLIIAVIFVATVQIVILVRIDWRLEADKAAERVFY